MRARGTHRRVSGLIWLLMLVALSGVQSGVRITYLIRARKRFETLNTHASGEMTGDIVFPSDSARSEIYAYRDACLPTIAVIPRL